MICAHLKPNRTIRDIVLGFEAATSRLYHLGMETSPKRSTISDSLANRPARVYEDYYRHLLASLNGNERRRMGMKLNLIDSTTIGMCIEKFEWAKYRKKKGGIKLHVMLDSKTHLAEQVLITNAVCHDMNAIRGVIEFKKGQMYVYDRGYACRNYLYDIELAGAFFVTRLESNWKIRVMKNRGYLQNKMADRTFFQTDKTTSQGEDVLIDLCEWSENSDMVCIDHLCVAA
jgi:hypothetical protein